MFVGVVWNAYRKCRLLLLNFILMCTNRLGDDPDLPAVSDMYHPNSSIKKARDLSQAIVASIPFHLYRNPTALLAQPREDSDSTLRGETLHPNSAYGGLLLMHVLQVVSRLPIVPESSRKSFSGALSRIREIMGIGQAGLLANVSGLDLTLHSCRSLTCGFSLPSPSPASFSWMAIFSRGLGR